VAIDFKSIEQNMMDLTTKYTNLESQFSQLREYLKAKSVSVPELNNF